MCSYYSAINQTSKSDISLTYQLKLWFPSFQPSPQQKVSFNFHTSFSTVPTHLQLTFQWGVPSQGISLLCMFWVHRGNQGNRKKYTQTSANTRTPTGWGAGPRTFLLQGKSTNHSGTLSLNVQKYTTNQTFEEEKTVSNCIPVSTIWTMVELNVLYL